MSLWDNAQRQRNVEIEQQRSQQAQRGEAIRATRALLQEYIVAMQQLGIPASKYQIYYERYRNGRLWCYQKARGQSVTGWALEEPRSTKTTDWSAWWLLSSKRLDMPPSCEVVTVDERLMNTLQQARNGVGGPVIYYPLDDPSSAKEKLQKSLYAKMHRT